jgi:SAM-dependent methyltransferase
MPNSAARSDDYVEYCRETAKHARDPHDLALRGRHKKEVTKRVHEQIAEAVDLHSGDDLVDIGCGDGTMLRIAAAAGANSAIGLLATDEEVAVLRRIGLNAHQGLTNHLPVPDVCASVVVCNNVLLVVPREEIPASLREIHRIAKSGARIFSRRNSRRRTAGSNTAVHHQQRTSLSPLPHVWIPYLVGHGAPRGLPWADRPAHGDQQRNGDLLLGSSGRIYRHGASRRFATCALLAVLALSHA